MSEVEGLGRLEKVELREEWKSESSDFTPWLAQKENISLLGQTIGMDLEVESIEKDVGPFRADILCKDVDTNNWVLIENQLERSDHSHLGQLITYAAGLQAVSIVWIAHRFTEEHRAALDWLNEMTGDDLRFFGLEIELWKIGDSANAPKFNVVSKPNPSTRDAAEGRRWIESGGLGKTQELQLEFWTGFRNYTIETGATFKATKPQPQVWMTISIGRSGMNLAAVASTWDSESGSYDKHELRAEFSIDHQLSKVYFAQFESQKQAIEAELEESLFWHNPPNKRICRMYVRRTVDLQDRSQWADYFGWLKSKLEKLQKVFGPKTRLLQDDLRTEGIDLTPLQKPSDA